MSSTKPRPHTPDPIRRPRERPSPKKPKRGMIGYAALRAALGLATVGSLAGCSTQWKLGPQEQEAIKQSANTGQVIGDLSGVPGGGQLGALIGTLIGTVGAGIGLYHKGKDKGWDDAAGKPAQANPTAAIATEIK